MGESAQKLLEIKNLSKNFGGINAVEDFQYVNGKRRTPLPDRTEWSGKNNGL